MEYDEQSHWYKCTDASCTKRVNEVKHTLKWCIVKRDGLEGGVLVEYYEHWQSCECGYETEMENCVFEYEKDENGHELKCPKCGISKGIKEEHTLVDVPANEATCSSTGATAGKKCSVCEKIVSGCEELAKKAHTEVDVAYKDSTCSAVGNQAGKKCSVCGEIISGCEEIEKKAHTPVVAPAQAATCTKIGYEEGTKCDVCGVTLSGRNVISKLGHNYLPVAKKEPTCTEKGQEAGVQCSRCGNIMYGLTEIAALGHTGGTATCTEKAICTTCQEPYGEVDPDNHNMEEATCEKPSTCKDCGHTEGTSLGHNYTQYNNNNNGTHDAICSRCGTSTLKTCSYDNNNTCICGAVQKTECEHDYQLDKAGATETNHWEKCTKCYTIRNVEKHTFKNGKCSVCDYQCLHTNTTQKKDETYHWDECNNCGEKLNKEKHSYADGKCEDCGRTEETKSCEHKNTTQKKDETYHWDECNDCGEKLNKEKHSYKDGKCEDCGLKDSTSSTGKLPNTGVKAIFFTSVMLIGFVTLGAIKMKKYKEI